jgi:hypothetical protein
MSNEERIIKKLEHIEKLLVFLCIKEKDQTDRIKILDSIGFQPKEISDLLGTTPNTVRVAKSRIKKVGKKPKDGK